MPADQIVIGLITAGISALGLWHRNWFLTETLKGRTLVERWGKPKAVRVVTIVLTIGVVGGLLLACNILRPLRW